MYVGSVELHPWISCLSLSVGALCQIVFSKAVIVESSDDSCAVAVWLMKRSAMCEDNLCVCSLFMWHRRGMSHAALYRSKKIHKMTSVISPHCESHIYHSGSA